MSQKVLQESGNYPTVAPGQYEAEVLEITEAQNKYYPEYDDGQPRIDVTFKFVIQDGEFEDSFVWGRTTPTFTTNPECKLRRWVEAIMNVGAGELPVGFILDYPDLVGKKVRIWVKHSAKGKARVDEVLPAVSVPAAVGASVASGVAAVDDFGEEPF